MKIAVCTFYTPEIEDYANHTTLNIRHYCQIHGYDYIEEKVDASKNISPKHPYIIWYKILLLYNTVSTNKYDWIFWIDCDAVITNKDIKLEDIINNASKNKTTNSNNDIDIIVTQEESGCCVISCGVMLIRNSDWSKNFLKAWYDKGELPNAQWRDQDTFIYFYYNNEDVRKRVKIIRHKIMNSFPDIFTNGDFIIHYAGRDRTPLKRFAYYRDQNYVSKRDEIPFLLNSLGLNGEGIEIGVQRGIYSEIILKNSNLKKFYLCDPWKQQDIRIYSDISNVCDENQEKLLNDTKNRVLKYNYSIDRINILRMVSKDAAKLFKDEQLDFVYIDANHKYEYILDDIKTWYPKVKNGGIISGHDYLDGELTEGSFGVKSAVIESLADNRIYITDEDWPSWYVIKNNENIKNNKSIESKTEIRRQDIKTQYNIDRRQWILNKCRMGEKILDIGSADGWIFKDTPFQSYLTSIDIDTYDIPNFKQMDAHHLEFPDKFFDIIILGELLEHVEDPVQVLKEANRAAKRILITVPDEINWSPENYPFETIEQGMKRRNLTLEQIVKVSNPNVKELYSKDNHRHLFHVRHYTEDTLKRDLEFAGITNYEIMRLQYGNPQWSFFTVDIRTTDDINTTDKISDSKFETKNEHQIGPTITTGPIIPIIRETKSKDILNNKYRIAIISTPFFTVPPKEYGGLEQVIWDLAIGLDELGYEVTIFGPEGSMSTPNGRLVITGPSINSVGINWFEEEKKRYEVYKGIITPDKYDIIHESSWFAFEYIEKINNPKLKILHQHHGSYVWESPPPFQKPNLVAISQFMQQYTIQYFKQRGFNVGCQFVYNGIDVEKYSFQPTKTDHLLFVGRMSTFKQPDCAIQVARKSNHKLDLIGTTKFVDSTEYVKLLEKSIENDPNITLYADAPQNLKIEKLQNAKALIFPSKMREPFGLVALEAMSCGTPVIATRDGAIPEIVLHNKTGFICDTIDDMVAAVSKIYTIKPEDCRKHVEENFSRLKMAKEYEKLYRKILEGNEW